MILSDKAQIVDLSDPDSSCSDLPKLPYQVINAIGGLGFQNEPLVCGGSPDASPNSYTNVCYSYTKGSWNLYSYNLTAPRAFGSYASNPGQTGVNFINVYTYKYFEGTSFWQLLLHTSSVPKKSRVAVNHFLHKLS